MDFTLDPAWQRLLWMVGILALIFVVPVRLQPAQLKKLAFLLWAAGGLVLLSLGWGRLFTLQVSDSNLLWFYVAIALALGAAKGRFVLRKTSQRNLDRIHSMSEPQRPAQVYSLRSWIMIGLMLGISASLTLFNADPVIRGVVNLAVGVALLTSSLAYLKPSLAPN
ncbi:MAG: hypothetical protein SFZ03_11250 [Candidatus Melainabacteria bacterium]|nr:hypothetical protein [Candidatus Melainabacteria bacterium]